MFTQKRNALAATRAALALAITTKGNEVSAAASHARHAYEAYNAASGRATGMAELWQYVQDVMHRSEEIGDVGISEVVESVEWMIEDAQARVDNTRDEWARLADVQLRLSNEYEALIGGR